MRAYKFGPFLLDLERRLVLKTDKPIPLTAKVFDTLLALVEHRSRVVKKDGTPEADLARHDEERTAVNISTLRKVLGDSPESHEYIVTVPGRGYRFVARAREENHDRPMIEGDAMPFDPGDSGAGEVEMLTESSAVGRRSWMPWGIAWLHRSRWPSSIFEKLYRKCA
jgi:DNA-binding winged helix-turn-helix (wHTH) protein